MCSVRGREGIDVVRRVGTCCAGPGIALGATLGVPGGVAVLVTSPPGTRGELKCNDQVLVPQRPPACGAASAPAGSIRAGDRLHDPASGLEVVCTNSGHGALTFCDR